MKYIVYVPFRHFGDGPDWKSESEHELIYVVDEKRGVCRYFLRCMGNERVRSMVEHVMLAPYGIYGTSVYLYNINRENLEAWGERLAEAFKNDREYIRKTAEMCRRDAPDSPSQHLNSDFIGYWR